MKHFIPNQIKSHCFKILTVALLFGLQFSIFAQEITIPATKEEMEKAYQENILQSRLYGVYIPKDVEDAFEEFIALSTPADITKFKFGEEDTVVRKLHFGIGRWMAVNWNFYEGSRLSHHLREMGLRHPDDMISFLIRVFHRKLNNRDEDREAVIKQLADARKIQLEPARQSGQ